MKEALLPDGFKQFAVVSFPVSHDRSQQVDAVAFVPLEDQAENLLFGIFHHGFTAHVRIGDADTRVKQSEIIVDFSDRAYSRPGIAVGGLLINGNNGTEA